jgi:hypothetical protein
MIYLYKWKNISKKIKKIINNFNDKNSENKKTNKTINLYIFLKFRKDLPLPLKNVMKLTFSIVFSGGQEKNLHQMIYKN